MSDTPPPAPFGCRVRVWLPVLVTAVMLVGVAVAIPQSSPPALQPVPHSDLSKLEAAVADQIRAVRASFEETTSSPDIPGANLAEAYGDLGRLYHAYELADAAEACYVNAALLAPADYRWHHLLGRLLESTGRLDGAVASYRKAVAILPSALATWVYLGDTLLQLNRPEEAQKAFETAIQINPNEAAALSGLGEMKLAAEQYTEAVGYLRRALELAPAANRLHYSLGMAYRGLGKLDEAREHLGQLGSVGVKPKDPLADEIQELVRGERVHLLQGRLAFSVGRYNEAAASFAEAARADPQSVRARVNLGTALGQLGDAEGAVQAFRAALDLDPQNVTSHFNLGTLMVRANRYDEAVKHLAAVVKQQPEDLEAQRELAKSLLRLGRNDEALQFLPAVVNEDLGDEDPLFALVNLWLRRGEYESARDLLSRAHDRFPSHGRTAHALARLLAACPDKTLRDGDRAVEIALQVYSASKRVSHGETLAMALAEQGSCDKAAGLQEMLISVADKAGESALSARLDEELQRYRQGPPCNPPASASP